MNERSTKGQQGVVLLAVLWLAVAMSVMALTTSYLVRTEVEAASNQIDAQRGYYLARGGIEAAVDSMIRSSAMLAANPGNPGGPVEFRPGQRWLRYEFPGGSCVVEVAPENAKLNVNLAPPEQLASLFLSLGLPAGESQEMAAAIVDWRAPRAPGVATALDLFYAALPHPYPGRHRALEQLEELLPVKGMSRELFFGRIERTAQGTWKRWPPLADLLTTLPAGAVNLNYASYEVLRTLPGWNDDLAAEVVAARTKAPFRTWEEMQSAVPRVAALAGLSPMTLSPEAFYTLTATGFLPDSKVRRSVRALVRVGTDAPLYHHVLAWWDDWPLASQPPEEREESSQGRSG